MKALKGISHRGQGHAGKARDTRVAVREKILCQATRLFGERGFGGVALRDIAKASAIPLSTLSSHFARKQDLQQVVFRQATQTIITRVLDSRLDIGDPKQRFRRYLVNVVELFLSDLPEMKVLDREFQELDKQSTIKHLLRASRDQQSKDSILVGAALVEDTKSGILNSISAVRLMQMIYAAIYGVVKLRSIHHRAAGGRPISNATLTRDIVCMFEHMLGI